MRQQIQQFGRTLSGMVMPNIGAFIAWGFITALFIPEGWWPNGQLAQLVGPMLTYLLPLLIAYTAGRNVAGERGGVIGAIAAVGVIVGSDIPMFIGAMIMGPLAGYAIRRFDRMVEGRVKAGFEMLVSNFSIGILGMLLAVLGYYVVGSVVTGLTMLISSGAELVIRHGLLPLVSLFVEPAKVLFLNNAVNHGIFSPIGIEQARETGQSIMFLLETNPGPGLGVLLAYWLFGRGNARQSAPGAVIIQFFGGIHEIYFPYILARPVLIVAAIAGSAADTAFHTVPDEVHGHAFEGFAVHFRDRRSHGLARLRAVSHDHDLLQHRLVLLHRDVDHRTASDRLFAFRVTDVREEQDRAGLRLDRIGAVGPSRRAARGILHQHRGADQRASRRVADTARHAVLPLRLRSAVVCQHDRAVHDFVAESPFGEYVIQNPLQRGVALAYRHVAHRHGRQRRFVGEKHARLLGESVRKSL